LETSLYVIKPEAMAYSGEIRTIIEKAGLIIIDTKVLVMPKWALKKLYPDLSEDLWSATCLAFASLAEAGLVIGENAVATLFRLSGTATAPGDCEPESIRIRFGQKNPFIIGEVRYYANAIHRPKNQQEAENDVRLFHQL